MNIFGLAKASTWTKLSLDVFGSVAQAESWTRCLFLDTRNGKKTIWFHFVFVICVK